MQQLQKEDCECLVKGGHLREALYIKSYKLQLAKGYSKIFSKNNTSRLRLTIDKTFDFSLNTAATTEVDSLNHVTLSFKIDRASKRTPPSPHSSWNSNKTRLSLMDSNKMLYLTKEHRLKLGMKPRGGLQLNTKRQRKSSQRVQTVSWFRNFLPIHARQAEYQLIIEH